MTNILIVDDSRTSRRHLRTLLEEEGLNVCGEAVNGEEGYQEYKKLSPDLVTLDITMPVLDGLEALKKIKTDFPNANVIMVSAAGQKNKLVEAVKLGASDFITKPFEKENLMTTIKRVLAI
ncbi:MAG: response regulator [Lachnospiraceae bacterium]|nr:response regulator [Lachnospiraceae bacterium]